DQRPLTVAGVGQRRQGAGAHGADAHGVGNGAAGMDEGQGLTRGAGATEDEVVEAFQTVDGALQGRPRTVGRGVDHRVEQYAGAGLFEGVTEDFRSREGAYGENRKPGQRGGPRGGVSGHWQAVSPPPAAAPASPKVLSSVS